MTQPDPQTTQTAVVQLAVDIERRNGKPHRIDDHLVKRDGRRIDAMVISPTHWKRLERDNRT